MNGAGLSTQYVLIGTMVTLSVGALQHLGIDVLGFIDTVSEVIGPVLWQMAN